MKKGPTLVCMNRDRFNELLEPLGELIEKKHGDYNVGRVQLEDYFPFGDKSYVQMLHVKTLRLVSLVNGQVKPSYESIEDTVRDLVNYGVFYLDYLEGARK